MLLVRPVPEKQARVAARRFAFDGVGQLAEAAGVPACVEVSDGVPAFVAVVRGGDIRFVDAVELSRVASSRGSCGVLVDLAAERH